MSESNMCDRFEECLCLNLKNFNKSCIYEDPFNVKFIKLDIFLNLINVKEIKCKTKIINGKKYVSFSNCIDTLKKMFSYKGICLGIFLGFYGVHKYDKYKLPYVKVDDIIVRPQYLFEYSVKDMVSNLYPEVKISREIDMLKKHSIPNIKFKDNMFRADLLLEKCDIVIEYDEGHHKNPEQMEKDRVKDILYGYLGYDILRCPKKNMSEYNILEFLKKLESRIKENLLRDEPRNFKEYILHFFKKEYKGIDEDIIKVLTEEVCDDIINGLNIDEIGKNIKDLSFNNVILPWLDIDYNDEENYDEIQKIQEIIESCDEPYRKENDDYILSSNAFDLVVMSLDENVYIKTKIIKRVLQKMKVHFQKYLFDCNQKNLKEKCQRRQFIPDVMNIGVEAGQLENIYCVRDLEKKIKRLEAENSELKFLMKEVYLPRDGRGTKRTDLQIYDEIKIGKPIVSEIPQIVYCPDKYIAVDDVLKAKYETNKMQYKIKKCFNTVLRDINEKLGQANTENDSIIRDLIFNVTYIDDYNPDTELIESDSDSVVSNVSSENITEDELDDESSESDDDLLNVI